MLDTTLAGRRRMGVNEEPDVLLADAGYWHTAQMQAHKRTWDRGVDPARRTMREGRRPGWEHGLYEKMRRNLKSHRGRKLYAQRKALVS
jgi:hypothetical protein